MKENNKQVVFYNAEKNAFLGKYKDRGSLAFEAGFIAELRSALFLPFDSYEEQKPNLINLPKRLAAKCLMWKLNTT